MLLLEMGYYFLVKMLRDLQVYEQFILVEGLVQSIHWSMWPHWSTKETQWRMLHIMPRC